MKRALGALGVSAVLAGGGLADGPHAQQSLVGTGRIHGQVLAADTGVPVPEAAVEASGVGRVYRATSDGEGRFQITGIIAGRFTVTASKPGFVLTSYGDGRSIDLADGAIVDKIDVRLARGGVIVVRVTDETGRPLPGVNVEALAYRTVSGERRMVVVSSRPTFQTDDRGEYRLSGLAPNDYYVRASVSQLALMKGIRPSGEGRMYLPTYYPGSAVAADARPLRLEAGQEVPAVMPLVVQRAAKISGRVQTTPEGLAGLSVMLRPREGAPTGVRMRLGDEGRFEADDVVPGEYFLSAQSRIAAKEEFAARMLTVESSDISDVVLTLLPGGTVSGRVVFEENAPAGPGIRPSNFATLVSAPGSLSVSSGRTSWNNDWTFQITGVVGTYLVRSVGPGWYLKAVLHRNEDITDTPLEIADGRQVSDVTVIVTQKYTELSGVAIDRSRTPVSAFTAIVFPVESHRWTQGSRFISVARSDRTGKFSVRGLPAGRYLVAAVDRLENGAQFDPQVLGRLQNDAVTVVLEETKPQTVTATLSR